MPRLALSAALAATLVWFGFLYPTPLGIAVLAGVGLCAGFLVFAAWRDR